MIAPALVRSVRNRAFTYTAILVLSISALAFAVVLHDDSMLTKCAGFFGGIGTLFFFLLSGSEIESYKKALAGEAPYAD